MNASENTSMADLLYGVPAIAAHVGMTEPSVRHRIDAGQFAPTFKIGGTICCRRSSIDAWLKAQETAAERRS